MAEKSDTLFDPNTRTAAGAETTDRTRAGADRASEDKYRKLIFFMPTALCQVDSRAAGAAFERLRADGVRDIATYLDAHQELVEIACDTVLVTEVNREAVSLFNGASPAELIRPVRYLFAATPNMAKRVMVSHFEGHRSYTEEAKIITFDGQAARRHILGDLSDAAGAAGHHLHHHHGITERLLTEAQLRQLQADYAHAARISTLGEVATSIAHEVKQPLAAIVTNGETALRWLERDDLNVAKVKQLTGRIVESAYHASEIVQRIRLMAVRAEPERVALNLKAVTAEAVSFIRHDIESKHIALSIDISKALPTMSETASSSSR